MSEKFHEKDSHFNLQDPWSGFSKLNREERLLKLRELEVLSESDFRYLSQGAPIEKSLADKFIENSMGYFQIPLGVAPHFVIDGKSYVIPMAVEETSIIAAASKSAKHIKQFGTLQTEVIGHEMIGQIQWAHIQNKYAFKEKIDINKKNLIERVNKDVAFSMVQRGGGVKRIEVRTIDREDKSGVMGIVHVYVDTCDAMGANRINQVCEYLKSPLEEVSGEKVTMCILSNLVDSKITRAILTLREPDPEVRDKIIEGSLFAQWDPYRAATHNKGILNGIDPILIATGNDWRAVEAGLHAYACRSGQYRSLTQWKKGEEGELIGVFEGPIIVGTVGGVTQLHPMAKLSLRMLDVQSADELSRICAAVGLVQNYGAIKALTTVGIIEGHMKLHIQNLALGAGAKENETPLLQKKLEEILRKTKRISLSNAKDILREMRTRTLERSSVNHSPHF